MNRMRRSAARGTISQCNETFATASAIWFLDGADGHAGVAARDELDLGNAARRAIRLSGLAVLWRGGAGPVGACAENFLPTVLDEAEDVVHLDFHTGLGRWAEGELLVSESEGLENCEWWREHFGEGTVTQVKSFTRSYEVRGGFGPWLRALFPQCEYRYATAEFGTYSAMRVIGALAEESRWHAELGDGAAEHVSRQRLAETFVPHSRSWRTKTLKTGLAGCSKRPALVEAGLRRVVVRTLLAFLLRILCGRIVFRHDAFEFLIAIGGEPLDNLDFESQLVFEAILFQTRTHGLGCELGIDRFARQGFQADPKTFFVLLNNLIFAGVEDATNRELENRWLKSTRTGFGFDVEHVRVAPLDRGD